MINLTLLKRKFRKDNPRWVILMIDLFIVFACYAISNFIFNSIHEEYSTAMMLKKSLLVIFAYSIAFAIMRTYKGIIRQTGINDATKIFKTVWLAFMILAIPTIAIRYYIPKGSVSGDFLRLSYIILFMHSFFTMVMLVAARVTYRSIYEMLFLPNRKNRNILIFGASRPGLVAYSLLREDRRVKNNVVAFVEDKVSRVGKRITGLRILYLEKIDQAYIDQFNISEVIIAVENNDPERLVQVTDHFHQLDLELKIMPNSRVMLNSGAKREIRPLKIEDLLGRKAIKIENPAIDGELDNKVILITGAAGSIGGELARQISQRNYRHLILLDQAESPLYDLQQSLKATHPDRVKCIVGDVRDKLFLERIFKRYRPQMIFHAAAYKHVPLMEQNPYEAIWTNLIGSKNMADLSVAYGIQKFVMVSTDKAVNPTNVMGATKRAAEIYVNSCSSLGKTNFIVTRFGNVLGSNGSVIPLFEKQMEQGGPLTLTHEDITRYFMTIPEACLLVQEAGVMGHGGEIFVFDMGKSVKIIDLAKRMIKLKGYRYPEDIDIKIVGLRPGEKIFEELLANDENTQKTHHPKIMIAQVNREDIEEKCQLIEQLSRDITSIDKEEINDMQLVLQLKRIVPEFKSQNSIFQDLDEHLAEKNSAEA
ncbi:nucleoside-diphosphate sugar epimerase/dehydratase [Sphingobacterium sp. SG20118]|uniref:polysaccharide biosynthesis protein n=1 Tax=Sphingobacterium TaxID=28453 RepID=UPI002468E3D3|nr:nucleoside-diphosphate sugar epimerase/dehydratase [Sphingobacterium faecium]MDH5828806.1 nucleoside-diphosphate sugar epimerase/dehydratase [Sphingobacterium faecium]